MFLDDIQKYIPITVLSALILFISKELLELVRKYRSEKRKKQALSLILSHEIQLNYWALTSFFRLLDELTYTFRNHPSAQYRLHIAYDGSEHLRLKEDPDQEYESGQAIPPFVNEQYKKLLPLIAELDQKLFLSLQDAYSKLAALEHFRKTVVEFLSGGDTHPQNGTRDFFIPKLSTEKDFYFNPLNTAYKDLTGNQLKEWKLM